MTPEEIGRISRSWVGHIATNPAVRDLLDAELTDTQMATLINETVQPATLVEPADIPAIKLRVADMYDPAQQSEVPDDQSVLDHTGPPGLV